MPSIKTVIVRRKKKKEEEVFGSYSNLVTRK